MRALLIVKALVRTWLVFVTVIVSALSLNMNHSRSQGAQKSSSAKTSNRSSQVLIELSVKWTHRLALRAR